MGCNFSIKWSSRNLLLNSITVFKGFIFQDKIGNLGKINWGHFDEDSSANSSVVLPDFLCVAYSARVPQY